MAKKQVLTVVQEETVDLGSFVQHKFLHIPKRQRLYSNFFSRKIFEELFR